MMQPLKSRPVRFTTLVVLLIVVAGLNLLQGMGSASAAQTIPPSYAHGWYINSPDAAVGGEMFLLGQKDGNWDNSHCTHSAVLLDFGQVKYQAGGTYGGYGVSAFGGDFYSYSAVAQSVVRYVAGWRSQAGPCPTLTLIIGVSNYSQCPSGGACTPYDAGRKWGSLVNNVQNWLIAKGYTPRITAWAGSDMEQPVFTDPYNKYWDCATKTRAFVDGFNANNPSAARFFNYGTAWVGDCWTASDVYYVSYGARYNWPFPEIYKQTAMDSWLNLGYRMTYQGVVTDCNNMTDPITGMYCAGSNSAWTPTYAWQQFWNKLQSTQGSLDYATNIQYQPDLK